MTQNPGLAPAEAAQRLRIHGPNTIDLQPEVRPYEYFVRQLRSPFVLLLVAAAAIAGFAGEWLDATVVLVIVGLNTVLGGIQELHAGRALAALEQLAAPRARVRRGGVPVLVPAAEIVPGDLLELEAGDLVAADAVLATASELAANEALLTGESLPVSKRAEAAPAADTRVFAGTSIVRGSGTAVVAATGLATELGKVALLVARSKEPPTPLELQLRRLSRVMLWACLGAVGLVFGLGVLRGEAAFVMFLTAVSLAVAAVPESLPAVVTIALAVGVQRMAKRRALVRRLHAVETLGAASVICSDKTGTLTTGEMAVRELVGSDPEKLLRIAVGCNSASIAGGIGIGDPTEVALLRAGESHGVQQADLARELPEVRVLPFETARKRMTSLRQLASGRLQALVKGAPEVIAARCTARWVDGRREALDPAGRAEIAAANERLAARGLRILAAAERELEPAAAAAAPDAIESELVFVGLIGLQDPPRPQAAAAVARCHAAGVQVAMITGDQPATALAIAVELGIAPPGAAAVLGQQIESCAEAELRKLVRHATVYARTTPEHKLRIVQALQHNGAVVAMTGDGVNDAPALHGADIGIAMGRGGTEVAREAAAMVLLDDDFATIVAAVEEGRGIYGNIKKTLLYLLAGNAGELILMAGCVAIGLPAPLLPVHLLWINLVTDGLPALCLATDPVDPGLMRARPRLRGAPIADGRFVTTVVLTGCMTAVVAFTVYEQALATHGPEVARARCFTVLVFDELLRSFSCRSQDRLVLEIGLASNLRLMLVVVISFALQFFAPHLPGLADALHLPHFSFRELGQLVLLGAIPLFVLEAWKLVRRLRA